MSSRYRDAIIFDDETIRYDSTEGADGYVGLGVIIGSNKFMNVFGEIGAGEGSCLEPPMRGWRTTCSIVRLYRRENRAKIPVLKGAGGSCRKRGLAQKKVKSALLLGFLKRGRTVDVRPPLLKWMRKT